MFVTTILTIVMRSSLTDFHVTSIISSPARFHYTPRFQCTDSGRDEEVLFHPFALTIILRKCKKSDFQALERNEAINIVLTKTVMLYS